jgi:hypothetical protein
MVLEPGQHISLITSTLDDKQIMRPYTPIECRGAEFDCIIKIYPKGAMS